MCACVMWVRMRVCVNEYVCVYVYVTNSTIN